VRGASRLASRLGVSRLFIGLTVVAFGTSAPEAVVGVVASLHGAGDLVLGNVVGSNIFNVLAVLGLSALILPLAVSAQIVRIDLPVLLGVSALVLLLARDGVFGPGDGMILLGGLVINTFVGYRLGLRAARSEKGSSVQLLVPECEPRPISRTASLPWNLLLLLVSLGMLVMGSRWLVESATSFARWIGLSDLVIGLTVVAVGTSLPEVATSVMAALRGERDIAVGNVIGSSLFNLLGVLGVSSLVASGGILVPPGALAVDLPVMLASAVLCLPVFYTGLTVHRWEGGLLLVYFALYTAYTLLSAAGLPILAGFTRVVGLGVLPATFLGLLWMTTANLIRRRKARSHPVP
jgi:cation:H+ antiporter